MALTIDNPRPLPEGVSVPDAVPVGVMVEIPSAAVVADLLVEHVDFLSIGSNDLIQYALAVDRVNARVAHLYEPAHPAMLRLIGGVVRVAEDRGLPVSLCGEMAGDRLFTMLLVGMGFRDLSLSARSLPEIKKAIRGITVEQAGRQLSALSRPPSGPRAPDRRWRPGPSARRNGKARLVRPQPPASASSRAVAAHVAAHVADHRAPLGRRYPSTA